VNETWKRWEKIAVKCWEDGSFKERLRADPAAILAAEGLQIPEGVHVHIVFDSEDSLTLVLPMAPARELRDADLDGVAGGWDWGNGEGPGKPGDDPPEQ
jgi:hypothetical protein